MSYNNIQINEIVKIKNRFPQANLNEEYLKRHLGELEYSNNHDLALTELDDWMRYNDLLKRFINYDVMKSTIEIFKKKFKKDINEIRFSDNELIQTLNEITLKKEKVYSNIEEIFCTNSKSIKILDETCETIECELQKTTPLINYIESYENINLDHFEKLHIFASYNLRTEKVKLYYLFQKRNQFFTQEIPLKNREIVLIKKMFNSLSFKLYAVNAFEYLNLIRTSEGIRKLRNHRFR